MMSSKDSKPSRGKHVKMIPAILTVMVCLVVVTISKVIPFSMEYIISSDKIEEQKSQYDLTGTMKSEEQSRAVIHMGIHKTGTTSIQQATMTFQEELREDGYEMPWAVNMNRWGGQSSKTMKLFSNQVNFASCFFSQLEQNLIHPCVSDLLLSGLEIANQGKKLLVSAETFSRIDSEGLKALFAYLSHWDDVVIVIYYRRYYDWTISMHNQQRKYRKLGETKKWTNTIVDSVLSNNKVIPVKYTSEVLSRVEEYFDNVILVNMHDDRSDIVEKFYCEVMPDAKHACDAVIHAKAAVHSNVEKVLIYADLAYAANEKGLISIKTNKEMKIVSRAIQEYQENTLNLTKQDFKMNCLPLETKEWLLDTSLGIEKSLFPDFFNSTKGEESLRADFKVKSKSSLCKIDADVTLEEQEWKEFLLSWRY